METSRLRQQLSAAGEQFGRTLKTFLGHKPLLRGNVYRNRRKCGKDGCRCTRGELHESWVYHVREAGVQSMRAVPKGQLAKWRAWTEHYRRFRLARRELASQYREMLRLIDLLESARAVTPPPTDNKKGSNNG